MSKSKKKKQWSVTIGWGRDSRPGDPDEHARACACGTAAKTTHTFATRLELAAFLQGVSASSGWDEYTIYSGDSVFLDATDGLYDDLRIKPAA